MSINLSFKQLFFSILLIICGCCQVSYANLAVEQIIEPYLIPTKHPLRPYLKSIFHDSSMFKSADHFKKAGFKVIRGHRRLMVGAHPYISDYLFKKFPDQIPQNRQLENFVNRVTGAQRIREYIKEHHFKHIVVPDKWIYKLPKSFAEDSKTPSYILIVEKMDIYSDFDDPNGTARQLYYNMDIEILTELCTILHAIGGCDAFPRNQPFTRSGQIAFVDTEHVGQMKGHFIKHIVPALNPDLQAYALALWMQLEDEERIRNGL